MAHEIDLHRCRREITKWALGNTLDAFQHGQITFIDRNDIMNLYVVTNYQLPDAWGATLWSGPARHRHLYCSQVRRHRYRLRVWHP